MEKNRYILLAAMEGNQGEVMYQLWKDLSVSLEALGKPWIMTAKVAECSLQRTIKVPSGCGQDILTQFLPQVLPSSKECLC